MSTLKITTTDSSPRSVAILAGVIRRVGNQWHFIDDQAHTPIGFKPAITEPTPASIQVNFERAYSKVLTCTVTADETYAQRGIVFGASCGLDKIVIMHSKAGVPTKNTDLSIPGSNIWIHVMMYE